MRYHNDKTFSKMFSRTRNTNMSIADNNSSKIHTRHSYPGVLPTSYRAVDLQHSRTEALLRQIDMLCAAEEAQKNNVLGRLGQQRSSQSPSVPRPDSSIKNWEVRSSFDLEGEIPDFGDDWLGSISVCSDDILSSFSPTTPPELREINLITSPVDEAQIFVPYRPSALPPINPHPRRTVSRLPVMQRNYNGVEKVVPGGCKLVTAEGQADKVLRGLMNLQTTTTQWPLAAPKRNGLLPRIHPAPPPRRPAPPSTPAPTNTNKRRVAHLQPGPTPPKRTGAAAAAFKPAPPRKPAPRPQPTAAVRKKTEQRKVTNYTDIPELQPLRNPSECLSQFFKLMSNDDWQKKMEGLKMMQALVQHHPHIPMIKLHEVCYAVTEEMKNLRSSVAAAAIDTLVYLYMYLQTAMDVQAEKTGQALLLKIAQATVNNFLQQQAAAALEVLVHYCSAAPVLNALLHTGLKHASPAVRESAAEMLHVMADTLGAEAIMTAGKTFTERFLVAVNKAAVDSSGKVRPHGLTILQDLMYEENFLDLWARIVPDKDRPYLEKNLKRMRRA